MRVESQFGAGYLGTFSSVAIAPRFAHVRPGSPSLPLPVLPRAEPSKPVEVGSALGQRHGLYGSPIRCWSLARGGVFVDTAARPDPAPSAGLGLGWTRVARAVSEVVPREEIVRIWLFAPVRREAREWGTAGVARRAGGDRLRVYTASYVLAVRGRERGQGRVSLVEVGESPSAVVDQVMRGVQERAGEPSPPVEIDAGVWFGEEHDEPAAQG